MKGILLYLADWMLRLNEMQSKQNLEFYDTIYKINDKIMVMQTPIARSWFPISISGLLSGAHFFHVHVAIFASI